MFAFRRGGFPLFVPLLAAVAFGYVLAGGGGSVIGGLLFLPLLALKMMAMFFIFGMMFRFAGGGRGGVGQPWAWSHRHGRTATTDSAGKPAEDPVQDESERDWEEALRAAKREIDKLFPNPRE